MATPDNTGHFGPWWMFCLARIFGERRIGYDSGIKITVYSWRGISYVWKVEPDLLDD